MMTGACTAARQERIRLRRMNGNGSNALVASNTTFAAIHTMITAPNVMRNFQLPPNSAMRSESRSPNVSFFFELLLDITLKDLVLVQALDDFLIERGKFADFVFQNLLHVILAEIAEVRMANESFGVQARGSFLDEVKKRGPN